MKKPPEIIELEKALGCELTVLKPKRLTRKQKLLQKRRDRDLRKFLAMVQKVRRESAKSNMAFRAAA